MPTISDRPAPHYTDATIALHHGDCLDVLRSMPDASVDAVVTDPPYGLEFMGKEWDSFGGDVRQPFRGEIQTPDNPYGRSTVRFAGASSYGARVEGMHSFQEWCEAWSRECLRVLKPGGHMLAFGGTRTFHRLACAVEDAGLEVRDSIAWLYGSGFPKSLNLVDDGGERTGWGTALKPAFEPIVVARKPLAGTVATNVLTHGTGALNIDGCRIGDDGGGTRCTNRDQLGECVGHPAANGSLGGGVMRHGPDGTGGRWPANVILDESQASELDAQAPEAGGSGKASGPSLTGTSTSVARGTFNGVEDTPFYGDQGGASRFFYVAKADTSERVRVDGVAHPTVKPLDLMRWLVRLVTPVGGTVLEPFAGSGTTVEACILEGFRCVAVEREADYLPLIVQRINRRRDPVAAVKGAGEDGGLFDLLDGGAA